MEPAEHDFGNDLDLEKPIDVADRPHVYRTRSTRSAKSIPTTALDWDGADDPENPQNWPFWLKVYQTVATGLLAFAVTFGSSVYTPGLTEVEREFNVSSTVALLGLALYVVGLGFGPVIGAPVSETFGRTMVYRISTPVCMLFTLGAGFSQTITQLVVCRFFAGLFGSPVLAVGAGTNADVWPPKVRAISTSIFMMAPFAGPALGPVVGGFAAMNRGWRWTQWSLLFVHLVAFAFSLGMKETYKKILLQRRSKRLNLPPPPAGPKGLAALKILFVITLARPLTMLATEPLVIFFSMYTAFAFAVLYAFFAAFPIVFEGIYHFNLGEGGLPFLGVGFGVLVAVVTGIYLDRTFYQARHKIALDQGKQMVDPEHRLYPAMIGSFGLPIGLFWFAWTSRSDVHWISPVLASIPFAWGNLCIFISCVTYLIDVYGPLNGASAMAANGILRYVLGGVFPLFTIQMFTQLGVGWATSVFGFISLLMLPIPWVLFKWGPIVRRRSAYSVLKD